MLFLSFAALWLAFSLFLLGRLAAHYLYIIYLCKSAFEAKQKFTGMCVQAARVIGVSTPAVLQHQAVRIPFLAGVIRPCIFLPLGNRELEFSRNAIFIHELAHLARHDNIWNLLRHLGIALLPFQPLLWVLSRSIEETSDFVCDDYVLRHGGNRAYAMELAAAARGIRPPAKRFVAGVGFFSFSTTLLKRVERILDTTRVITLRAGARLLVFVSFLCLCITLLSGLVGFRGKSFAQVKKAAEFIEKGRLFATLAGLSAVTETQIKLPPDSAPVEMAAALSPGPGAGNKTSGPVQPDDSPDTADNTFVHADSLAALPGIPPEIAAAQSVSEQAPSRRITEDADLAERNPSPVETAYGKTAGRDVNADSLFRAELRGFQAAVLAPDEQVTAHTGPLEVEISETPPGSLRESLEEGQENPVWSPAGKVIAFTGIGGRGIWVVPVTGGKPSLLCDNIRSISPGAISGKGLAQTLCFSPDGKELAFVNYTPEIKTTGAAKAATSGALSPGPVIESVNLATGERKIIVENAIDGSWSRDGRYFVYVEGDSYGIGILDAADGKRRIVSPTGLSPCMTPDGVSIIYVDQSGVDRYDLYRVFLSGREPERLTTDGSWWGPEISPNGEWVLCTGFGMPQYSRNALLRAFNLRDNMSYFIMIEGAESAEMGTWSPTGRQFCYTRTEGMDKEGYTVRRTTIYIEDFQPSSLDQPAEDTAHPSEFKLVGNFPNPFNPTTTIRFSLPSSGPAELIIYNMMGQKIRELVSGRLEAGMHSVVWNGRDRQNRPVSSGIYVARLKMEGKVETRRMTLVK